MRRQNKRPNLSRSLKARCINIAPKEYCLLKVQGAALSSHEKRGSRRFKSGLVHSEEGMEEKRLSQLVTSPQPGPIVFPFLHNCSKSRRGSPEDYANLESCKGTTGNSHEGWNPSPSQPDCQRPAPYEEGILNSQSITDHLSHAVNHPQQPREPLARSSLFDQTNARFKPLAGQSPHLRGVKYSRAVSQSSSFDGGSVEKGQISYCSSDASLSSVVPSWEDWRPKQKPIQSSGNDLRELVAQSG